ncbi:conserved membrane hypothetical protein [Microbacterium sp. C448]|uniref:hypothetical protein n=1 Tax=Microbacterium sp. C448 TaxID=1177594 RepID=UPI0003DE69BF|nr:hypothetical protein [Microbacterium sp. C448]CDK01547.1 conserved membrane hypothetical protein [Microbacterium sp. C448]
MTNAAEGRGRSLLYILGATVVAGASGYAIQLLAPALLPSAETYLSFAAYWSTLYLLVAAVAGVQQEVTRATRAADTPPSNTTLRTFTFLAAVALTLIAVLVGAVLSGTAFAAAPVPMTAWFVIGLVGYLFTAVFAGVLSGLGQWRAVAALIALDGILRGVAVTSGMLLGAPLGVLAALISVPFILAFGVIWLAVRANVIGRFRLDVGARRLWLNAARTVAGAAATGVLVTGLPALLRAAMPDADPAVLAGLIFVITATRAPLIIPLLALQSYLIVDFRSAPSRTWRLLLRYGAIVLSASVVFAACAWLWGPPIVGFISGGRFMVQGPVAAAVVVSGGLVALMCVTGPALLAHESHRWYVRGWMLAAVTTIVFVLLPLDPVVRTVLALLVAPALGAVVHLIGARQDPSMRHDPESVT